MAVVPILPAPVKAETQFSKTDGKMVAAAGKNKIRIGINVPGTGTAKLYAYEADEYRPDDPYKGESLNIKETGTEVGTYTMGKGAVLGRARYDGGKDNVYQKYYLVQNGNTVAGPVYVNNITPEHDDVSFKQDSIKGVFNEDNDNVDDAKSLGASSVTYNINTSSFLYPLESEAEDNSIPYKFDGRTWYFSRHAVGDMDKKIESATKAGMNTVIIMNAWGKGIAPDYFRYSGDLKEKSAGDIFGMNTSNDQGCEYYEALMDFLGQRYTEPDRRVNTWVLSNEIDTRYFMAGESDFNKYMEEYSRELRLADIAMKKGARDTTVVVPFTHFWKRSSASGVYSSPEPFMPSDMISWLAGKTDAEGSFDWGIAIHPYSASGSGANYAMTDTSTDGITGDYRNTTMITFSNMEALGDYLKQPDVEYNGHQRSVYITEGGMSSCNDTDTERAQQAASIIQGYYRCANLPFVKMFNYYRFHDNASEVSAFNLRTGLRDTDGRKKPSYEAYQHIDDASGADYAAKYLPYIDFYYNGGHNDESNRRSTASGTVRNWSDALNIYAGTDWKKSFNPVKLLKSSILNSMSDADLKKYIEKFDLSGDPETYIQSAESDEKAQEKQNSEDVLPDPDTEPETAPVYTEPVPEAPATQEAEPHASTSVPKSDGGSATPKADMKSETADILQPKPNPVPQPSTTPKPVPDDTLIHKKSAHPLVKADRHKGLIKIKPNLFSQKIYGIQAKKYTGKNIKQAAYAYAKNSTGKSVKYKLKVRYNGNHKKIGMHYVTVYDFRNFTGAKTIPYKIIPSDVKARIKGTKYIVTGVCNGGKAEAQYIRKIKNWNKIPSKGWKKLNRNQAIPENVYIRARAVKGKYKGTWTKPLKFTADTKETGKKSDKTERNEKQNKDETKKAGSSKSESKAKIKSVFKNIAKELAKRRQKIFEMA